MSSARAFYRARQVFASLRPRISEAERGEVADFLGEALFPLFVSMTPRDQRHSLDVFLALGRQGCADRDMLTAALLHDVGKGGRVCLWHRVAYVLLAAAAPSLLPRLGGGIAALRDHAAHGARLAAAAGAAQTVVRLIREHEQRQRGQEDERLLLLRAADDSC